MSVAYQCPKSHGSNFVLVSKTHRLEPRSFLWWTWMVAIHTGWIVRCPDHACGRFWRVGLDGVHEPAGSAPVAPPRIEKADDDDDEREERPAAPPLGLAVRRPRL